MSKQVESQLVAKAESPKTTGVLQRVRSGEQGEDFQEAGSPFYESRFQANLATIPVRKVPNKTGLPDDLKAGVEALSGFSLDDVRVHYNSSKPAQLQALAYTQGTEIHVGPGQERHLAHEAWHVVQQMQGRVKPTMQMKGVQMNDDVGLEREADVMGIRLPKAKNKIGQLVNRKEIQRKQQSSHGKGCCCQACTPLTKNVVMLQRVVKVTNESPAVVQGCFYCADPACNDGERCGSSESFDGLLPSGLDTMRVKHYNERQGHGGRPEEWEHVMPGAAYRQAGMGAAYRTAPVLAIPTGMHRGGVSGSGGGISSTGRSETASGWSSLIAADIRGGNFAGGLRKTLNDEINAAMMNKVNLSELAHGLLRIINGHLENGQITQMEAGDLMTLVLNRCRVYD